MGVLNSVVDCLYEQMTSLIELCSPEGLIEAAIARNERYVYENAHLRLTLPTRVECFGSVPEIAAEITREFPLLDKASVANRFIIEYVAACPPKGSRVFSLSLYDRILSLSSLIIHFANISDLIKIWSI